MIKIFITLIILIMTTSAVLYNQFSLSLFVSKNTRFETDKKQINEIKNILIKNIIDYNGNKIIPFGINDTNTHKLPLWLNLRTKNPFGKDYIYCPFNGNTGAYNSIVNTQVGSYEVEIINNEQTDNKNYVLSSENITSNILAIIISNHNENIINCNDIIADFNFKHKNGIVEIIYYNNVIYNDIVKKDYNFITDINIFNVALNALNNKQNNTDILEFDGNVNINLNNNIMISGSDYEKSTLILKSNNGTNFNLSGSSNIEIINKKVIIENANLLSGLSIDFIDSEVIIRNSNISDLNGFNSSFILENVVITGESSFNDSKLILKDNFSINTALNVEPLILFNSDISGNNVIINNNSTLKLASMFVVDHSSSLSLYNSAISSNTAITSAIYTSGIITIRNTAISAVSGDNGIILNEGGKVNLNTVSIGSASNRFGVGISDLGGSFISGYDNTIYGLSCHTGNLFNNVVGFNFNDNTGDIADLNTGLVNQVEILNSSSIDLTNRFNKLSVNCL